MFSLNTNPGAIIRSLTVFVYFSTFRVPFCNHKSIIQTETTHFLLRTQQFSFFCTTLLPCALGVVVLVILSLTDRTGIPKFLRKREREKNTLCDVAMCKGRERKGFVCQLQYLYRTVNKDSCCFTLNFIRRRNTNSVKIDSYGNQMLVSVEYPAITFICGVQCFNVQLHYFAQSAFKALNVHNISTLLLLYN